jgi:hypothetical protein
MWVFHVKHADFAGSAGDAFDKLYDLLTHGATRAEDLNLAFGIHSYHLHSEVVCVPELIIDSGPVEHRYERNRYRFSI